MLAAALALVLAVATLGAVTTRVEAAQPRTFDATLTLAATTTWSVFREGSPGETCTVGEHHVGTQEVTLRSARPTPIRLRARGRRYVVDAAQIAHLRGVVRQAGTVTARDVDSTLCSQHTYECVPRRLTVRSGSLRVAAPAGALYLDRLRYSPAPRSLSCAAGTAFVVPLVRTIARGDGAVVLSTRNNRFVLRGTATRSTPVRDDAATGVVRQRITWTLTLRRR